MKTLKFKKKWEDMDYREKLACIPHFLKEAQTDEHHEGGSREIF